METQLHRVRAPAGINPEPRHKKNNHHSGRSRETQEQSTVPQEEEFCTLILYNSQGRIVKKY